MARYRRAAGYSTILALLSLLPPGARADDPILIGVSGAFTGGSSAMGISARQGIETAVKEVNAKGGILGRPLQLVERDDEGKNEVGVQVTQELIDKSRVVASIGFVNTGVALAAQRFYEEAEIPVMSCGTTGTVVTRQFLPPEYRHNYVFRNGIYDSLQASKMVEEAVDRRKFSRIAIMADSTNYGQLGRADVEAALSAKGVTPVAVEKFNLKDVDMSAQLLRARQAGAEVILTYGIGPELAQIANGMTKLGWKVPLIGSNPMAMSSFVEIAGVNAEGARMVQSFIPDEDVPRQKAFVQTILAEYKVPRVGNVAVSAQCYDALHILVAAIAQARSTDGPKIRAALENLEQPVEGIVATYRHPFSADNHDAFEPRNAVIGEIRNGTVVFAYDSDRRR